MWWESVAGEMASASPAIAQARGHWARAMLLEQFEALGIGQGLEDRGALGAGEPQRPRRFRSFDARSKIFFHSHRV